MAPRACTWKNLRKWILPAWALVALFMPDRPLGAPRLQYITAGPMLHWNFGNGPMAFSIGVEAAYWNYPPGDQLFIDGPTVPGDGEVGFGIDLGLEWEPKKFRIYAEPQLGLAVAGIALGPVLEFDRDSFDPHLGAQGSIWANPLWGGADIRGRIIEGRKSIAPGLYVKAPVPL